MGKKKNTKGDALIWVSDTHINHLAGVIAPSVTLEGGGTYVANGPQRALWEAWIDFADWSRKLTEGYNRVLVLGGDILEHDTKHRTHALVTRNPTSILTFAITTLEPLLDFANSVYVIRGTTAHVGKSASLEEKLARDITIAIPDESRHTSSWWHVRAVLGGVKFDLAHHPTGGGRLPHTRINAANKLAYLTHHRYTQQLRQPPPDVVQRGHNHFFSTSGQSPERDTFACISGCWQLNTEYGYRIGGENDLPNINGNVYLCADGQYEFHPRHYPPKEGRDLWEHKPPAP